MPATATQETVEATIVEAISRVRAEPDQVTRDATFEQLDVDSLDLVEVAQIVEEEFGVVLKGEDMEQLKTVGDAIDLVVSRAHEPSCGHNRRRRRYSAWHGCQAAVRALGRRRVRDRGRPCALLGLRAG